MLTTHKEGQLTVAARAHIDHVVQIAFNMVVDVAAELHLSVARLFVRSSSLHASSTSAARERSSHARGGSKYVAETAGDRALGRLSGRRAQLGR